MLYNFAAGITLFCEILLKADAFSQFAGAFAPVFLCGLIRILPHHFLARVKIKKYFFENTQFCLTKSRVERAILRFCLSASSLAELHADAWFALFRRHIRVLRGDAQDNSCCPSLFSMRLVLMLKVDAFSQFAGAFAPVFFMRSYQNSAPPLFGKIENKKVFFLKIRNFA